MAVFLEAPQSRGADLTGGVQRGANGSARTSGRRAVKRRTQQFHVPAHPAVVT